MHYIRLRQHKKNEDNEGKVHIIDTKGDLIIENVSCTFAGGRKDANFQLFSLHQKTC